jgi:hypothetical protein
MKQGSFICIQPSSVLENKEHRASFSTLALIEKDFMAFPASSANITELTVLLAQLYKRKKKYFKNIKMCIRQGDTHIT